VRGHGSEVFFAVHVFSRSPVRPWTKTILIGRPLVSKQSEDVDHVVLACARQDSL
jgi:hypothetical protein